MTRAEEKTAKRVGWILAALFASTMALYTVAVADDTTRERAVTAAQQSPS